MVAVNTKASGRQPRAFHLSDNPVGQLVWRELGTDLGDRRMRKCASVGEQEGRHHQVSSVGLGDDDGGIWIGLDIHLEVVNALPLELGLEPYAVSAPCRCEERHTFAVSATLATTRSIARLFLATTQSGDVPAGTSPSSTLARHLAASNSSGQDQQQTFEVPERLSATMVT